jgi:C-terminal processing protease CtpA/Prc
MAFVRSDQYLDEDISSMDSKNLFTYHSTAFDDSQREAIDQFKKEVNLKFQFDRNKFSQPYFMVLNYHDSLYLDLPIYILCDEGSFSAASIMASVFKGLNNVQVCGTTTNDSSGRSGRFSLPNSKIQLKLSTMLFFQKNGLPLDGYGTIPDIVIPRDEQQILGKQDSQLKTLIEIIKTRHNKQ